MRIRKLVGKGASGLAAFERAFWYPLGKSERFRIEHGRDYLRFFRAQGPAVCFLAETGGKVVGAVSAAIVALRFPDGRSRPCAYVGDLKILPEARGGIVLSSLSRALAAWARPRCRAAYSVVMAGTRTEPPTYTGRAGLPAFTRLADLSVWRLRPPRSGARPSSAAPPAAKARHKRLSKNRFASPGGSARLRSRTPPKWILNSDGSACGLFEDTRRAKRLFSESGKEIVSAHLSSFACQNARSGAALVRSALGECRARRIPALFVCLPPRDAALVKEFEGTEARAAVFGTGLPKGFLWNFNSAEI